ncbi:uncharacterized protein LOC100832053 [Brachypodium distachyon]|uniref:USP domain-containing protein n=1 Tax=Brachypodium distachyon TaxID=15368 RepID=A0A2K2D2H9_BRADI|nr:uncharacterized protein LOC100832053 [Brachypodium distachyon]PNT68474.1 hypothetical protein BRADI_3g40994v3 [Brachypodium distachyon]PNT68475.1 hypothetical protein BRADI_3g40994v3 [Brachypodium distachyon]|eukprot:XP_003572428.1 uncharacterized protein LOC100832053 [Brachypodium distachyon]
MGEDKRKIMTVQGAAMQSLVAAGPRCSATAVSQLGKMPSTGEAEATTNDSTDDMGPCEHFFMDGDELVYDTKTAKKPPKCVHYPCTTTGREATGGGEENARMMVCAVCKSTFCSGVVDRKYPQGHAHWHANLYHHWAALWYDEPCTGYCFQCRRVVRFGANNWNKNEWAMVPRKRDEWGMVVQDKTEIVTVEEVPNNAKDECGMVVEHKTKILTVEEVTKNPQKSQHLDLLALDGAAPRCSAETLLELSKSPSTGEEEVSSSYSPVDDGRCEHIFMTDEDLYVIANDFKTAKKHPKCQHNLCRVTWKRISGGSEENAGMMLCTECSSYFCTGPEGDRENPQGHASWHAKQFQHWVLLWYDEPYKGYCFECRQVLRLSVDENACAMVAGNGKDEWGMVAGNGNGVSGMVAGNGNGAWGTVASNRNSVWGMVTGNGNGVLGMLTGNGNGVLGMLTGNGNGVLGMLTGNGNGVLGMLTGNGNSVWGTVASNGNGVWGTVAKYEQGMVFSDAAGSHVSQIANGNGYVIKGIPNLGSTCYMNASLQCLLALGKLRTMILRPDARLGIIGLHLKQLFDAGTNDSRRMLDPRKLLDAMKSSSDMQFMGMGMQDSHDFLTYLLSALDKEVHKQNEVYSRRGFTEFPKFGDSIFKGQQCQTLSCKSCPNKSVSHGKFHDLQPAVALPSKDPPARSVTSSLRSENGRSPKKPHEKLFQQIDKGDEEKIQRIAGGGDSQNPCSELADGAMEKKPKPLQVDSTEVKDVVNGHLKTRKNDVPGKIIEVQIKALDFIPNLFDDSDTEEMGEIKVDFHNPEDIGPPPLVNIQAKENTCSVEVTKEDKGKAQSRSDIIYDVAEHMNSLSSIEDCLALLLLERPLDWTCDDCSNVAKLPRTNISSINGEQVKLDYQRAKRVHENLNEQKDGNGGATQTILLTKLPPVLTIQLKRYKDDLTKMRGHVSFKEILDVGPFMDPSCEDKGDSRYRLVGVIEHLGANLGGGHYIAYVRAGCNEQSSGASSWVCANDHNISQVSLQEVLRCEAYVLFYERMED